MDSNGKIDSTHDFTPEGLVRVKNWLEPWFLSRATSLGSAPVPTPPLTNLWVSGVLTQVSAPSVAAVDTSEDVSLDSGDQLYLSRIDVTGSDSQLYGTDWNIILGDGGYIYVTNAIYEVGDDGLFYRRNDQITVGANATAYLDTTTLSGGANAELFGRNVSVSVAAGASGSIDFDVIDLSGGTDAAVKGLDWFLQARGAGTATNVIESRAVNGDATALELKSSVSGSGDKIGLKVRPDIVFTAAQSTEPATIANQARLYLWNDSGTLKLRVNIDGTAYTLAP